MQRLCQDRDTGECGGGKAQVRCLIVVEVGSNLFVWPYAVEDRLRPPGGQGGDAVWIISMTVLVGVDAWPNTDKHVLPTPTRHSQSQA